ncbi:MAG: porin, partial [Sphingobium sp.]
MTSFRRAGCAILPLIAATPALAQPPAPSTAELVELVRAQAAEIAALKDRLARVEAAQSSAAAQAPRLAQAEA